MEASFGWLILPLFGFLGWKREDLEMLLKGLLSEPDWLSETNLHSKEASSLNKRKTQENVNSESNVLSTQPARPAKPLSLLALSVSKLAKSLITNSHSARHAGWVRIHNPRIPKVIKNRTGRENKVSAGWEKRNRASRLKEATFFTHSLHHSISILFQPCIEPSLLMEG